MNASNSLRTAIFALGVVAGGTCADAQQVSRDSSRGAFAMFTSTDATGCVQTTVFVTAGDSLQQNPPQAPVETRSAVVTVQSFDSCNVAFAFLFGVSANYSLTTNTAMTSARLIGTVPVCDSVGACTDLFLDIEW